MKNVVDDSVIQPGRRGPRGPRPVVFYAIPAGTKFEESVVDGDANHDKAIEALKAKLGKDAIIIGPLNKKGGASAMKAVASSSGLVVKIDLRDLKFTGKRFTGIHANHNFFANGVAACIVNGESFADNELLNIQIEDRVDSNVNSPKPRISNKVVRRALIEEILET